ncbi:MAG: TetR/AcrR family transcriptional regulator [Ilumatobacter sp.]|uniref:TetR/AcrR family transcriptional regulator n=1 Tax=Ilumatobacter sp. TaxID=1967498 RepID=UPI003296C24F
MQPATIFFHSVPIELSIDPLTPGSARQNQFGPTGPHGHHDRAETTTDGRHVRRSRNRDRVVEQFIHLARTTGEAPETTYLAEASRVSVRSIYRYFTSHEELLAAVAERLAEHASAQFGPFGAVDHDTDFRISTIVDSALRFHQRYGPALRLAAKQDRPGGAIDAALRRIDESRCNQVHALLDQELVHDEHRDDTIAIICISLSAVGLTQLTQRFPGQTSRIRELLHRHIATQLQRRSTSVARCWGLSDRWCN